VVAMIGASAVAEREARAEAVALGVDLVEVMTAPRPARLVTRDVIVVTGEAYRRGSWAWGREPRLVLAETVPVRRGPDAVIDRALERTDVRHYLTWSRYPYFHATEGAEGGWRVWIGDARYPGRGLGGLEVRISE
jgi:hypothetical protein